MGMPKLAMVTVLLVLVALASTMTYAGFLVIGVVAEYLGTGRGVAGLLLGVLFARFPWIRQGRPRIVGILPKPVRRPFMVGLLALCFCHFVWRSEMVPAIVTGFTIAFILALPWLKRAVLSRVSSSLFQFASGPTPRQNTDHTVIEGEFTEKKD